MTGSGCQFLRGFHLSLLQCGDINPTRALEKCDVIYKLNTAKESHTMQLQRLVVTGLP